MAGTNAVIIVPTQGEHAEMFLGVAKQVDRKQYGGRAEVVKTTVTQAGDGTLSVSFATSGGKTFNWADAHDLKTVITISHGASGDGPNLAYHAGGYQPWATDSTGATLTAEGQTFWKAVAKALKADGKIILVGCYMGSGDYARAVAKAAGRKVFAADGLFAAANTETTLKHVKAIEDGKAKSPMKKFDP